MRLIGNKIHLHKEEASQSKRSWKLYIHDTF